MIIKIIFILGSIYLLNFILHYFATRIGRKVDPTVIWNTEKAILYSFVPIIWAVHILVIGLCYYELHQHKKLVKNSKFKQNER